jgi:hypothetical protein
VHNLHIPDTLHDPSHGLTLHYWRRACAVGALRKCR